MDKKQALKKAGKIASDVLLYLFLAICLVSVIITITAKRDSDGTATIFGTQIRFVKSPSMEKCKETDVSKFEIKDIPTKSMIFVDVVPYDPDEAKKWYDDLEVGDVLTFKYVYVKQETITHRITDIEEIPGGYIITLKGDNKNADSDTLEQTIDTTQRTSPNYIIGKVTGQSYPLGLFFSALNTTVGIICIVMVPALAIIIFECIKIVNMINAEKHKKESAEREKQQSEIDELRKKLAELEAGGNAAKSEKTEASDNSESK